MISQSRRQPQNLNQIIKCYHCEVEAPRQFILLLCDHVLCSVCVQRTKETLSQYSSVKCDCGSSTFFKIKSSQRHSTNHRKTDSPSKCRFSTQINSLAQPETTHSSLFQKTHYILENNQKRSLNQSTCSIYSKSQRKSQNFNRLNQPLQPIASQLYKEIEFIKIQYQKELGMIQSKFNKVLKVVDERFRKIISQLKDMCLKKIVLNEHHTGLDMPKTINQKYHQNIGIQFEKINEFLRGMLMIGGDHKSKKVDLSQFCRKQQKKLIKKGMIKKRTVMIQL